jgi:hypothetical protein
MSDSNKHEAAFNRAERMRKVGRDFRTRRTLELQENFKETTKAVEEFIKNRDAELIRLSDGATKIIRRNQETKEDTTLASLIACLVAKRKMENDIFTDVCRSYIERDFTQTDYITVTRVWKGRHEIDELLLGEIEEARMHNLIEDGSTRKVEELTQSNEKLRLELQQRNRRIVSLEAYIRLHNGNPDDATDTYSGDVS